MAGINIDPELRSKLISRYYIKSLFWKQLHQRRRNILEAENSSRCDVMSRGFLGIPGSRWLCIFFDECWNPSCGFQSRYIPTKNNWEIWKLEKEFNSMIEGCKGKGCGQLREGPSANDTRGCQKLW
ncbi:hypothetical protein Peur_022736 [Populus x canadensis]